MISSLIWLCLGIFLGATYPFLWKTIKAWMEKGLNFIKSSTPKKEDNNDN